MTAANPERGEFNLVLDGAVYGLRPSWEAIQAFEDETGKGLIELARSCMGGMARTREVAIVATHCIRAMGRASNDASLIGVNVDKVGKLIGESDGGNAAVTMMIGAMLGLAITGGITSEGEVKVVTEPTSPTVDSAPAAT